MTDKNILHMLTPLKHMSPFDANMALDAGYDAVLTYANVTLEEVSALVQDAMFSRPPKTSAARTRSSPSTCCPPPRRR
jgi:methylene-tetrahydromethanopterin dehydrogenase